MLDANTANILYFWIMSMTKLIRFATLLVLIIGLAVIPACDKEPTDNSDTTQNDTNKIDTNGTQAYLEQMFAAMVLEKKIKVVLAIDSSGKNITPEYDNHDILLRKETFYDGPLDIFANGTKYVGTWKCNKDYSILELNITGLSEFGFYNTVWRFTQKSLDLLKIAPVQNPGLKQLHLKKE